MASVHNSNGLQITKNEYVEGITESEISEYLDLTSKILKQYGKEKVTSPVTEVSKSLGDFTLKFWSKPSDDPDTPEIKRVYINDENGDAAGYVWGVKQKIMPGYRIPRNVLDEAKRLYATYEKGKQ